MLIPYAWITKLALSAMTMLNPQPPPAVKNSLQELPQELRDRIFWQDYFPRTMAQIPCLHDKIVYCLRLRTVNKAFRDHLTVKCVLDFCKPINVEEINLLFKNRISKCPLDIAKLLIHYGADINYIHSYDRWVDHEQLDRIEIGEPLTPLQYAIKDNNIELAKKLQALGANKLV